LKEIKKKILFIIATKFAWLLVLFLPRLARISVRNRHYWKQAISSGSPVIIITWHGRMLIPIYMHRNQGIVAMVSEHADGEMIAQTIIKLGYRTVRGSSTRGGSKALRQMLRLLRNGGVAAILPDGPNGPRQYFKPGAVLLAQMSGAYLLPLTFSAQKPIRLRSWDGFTLWKPFSRIIAMYGAPIKIPRNMRKHQLESFRKKVEDEMNALQSQVDAIFQ